MCCWCAAWRRPWLNLVSVGVQLLCAAGGQGRAAGQLAAEKAAPCRGHWVPDANLGGGTCQLAQGW